MSGSSRFWRTYCYGCHGNGERKGGHAFDEFKSDNELVGDIKLWLAVLKNVRSGVMPPPGEERPGEDERRQLFEWIERDVFAADPADPDPGRVTLRRLNRVEYRNTIRDLTGVDYDTSSEFPPDDAGYGFDNIGDAMSVSPLLMEKYLNAARAIAAKAVPAGPPDDKDTASTGGLSPYFRSTARRQMMQRSARRMPARFLARSCGVRIAGRSMIGTVDRLVALAKGVYTAPEQSFESGIEAAMVAVLASPRFLFRVEEPAANAADSRHPLVDEFSLASRLSYFLWSTMPDEELLQLAERGELRAKLSAQVERMLKDPRSEALAENFAGQWLRARDIEHIDIDPLAALGLQPEFAEAERDIKRLRREREQRIANGEKLSADKADETGRPSSARTGTHSDRVSPARSRWATCSMASFAKRCATRR